MVLAILQGIRAVPALEVGVVAGSQIEVEGGHRSDRGGQLHRDTDPSEV